MEKVVRTCGYSRTSSKQEWQEYSLAEQIDGINEIIESRPNHVNVGCYVDFGKSGTNQANRRDFLRMMRDAKEGKIDLIITKSISRFGRNTVETMTAINQLREWGVAVEFIVEKINTIVDKNDMLLTTYAQIAESEAEDISTSAQWSVQRRFEKGQVIINPNTILGYGYRNGELYIIEEEAKIIRYIYERYASGMGTKALADELNEKGWRTAFGSKFLPSSIIYIIRNEKYKGDLILQKTISVLGRSHKNVNERPMYYVENAHEPIVSKELWEKAHAVMQSRLKKGKPKEKNDLNGIIVCGHCGHNYQVTKHSSDTQKREWYTCYWRSAKGKKYCRRSESIKRTTILDAYKKVVEFVKGQPPLKTILNPTTETLDVEVRIKTLMAQEKLFLQMKARGMASDEIDTEHRRVVYRIKEAERERKRLMANNIHNATAHNDLVDFNNTIKGMGAVITYNESQYKKIVKRIVVYSREEIDIVLRNGMTAKVHIEEMCREDDIIGEIEYGISEEYNDNKTA